MQIEFQRTLINNTNYDPLAPHPGYFATFFQVCTYRGVALGARGCCMCVYAQVTSRTSVVALISPMEPARCLHSHSPPRRIRAPLSLPSPTSHQPPTPPPSYVPALFSPQLNGEMLSANARIDVRHNWESLWWEWPLNLRGLLYYSMDKVGARGSCVLSQPMLSQALTAFCWPLSLNQAHFPCGFTVCVVVCRVTRTRRLCICWATPPRSG